MQQQVFYNFYRCFFFLWPHLPDQRQSNAFDKVKIFRNVLEKSLGRVIKVVHSDRGGEYYGRYTESNQHMRPFAEYFPENCVVSQYNMSGSLRKMALLKGEIALSWI